MLWRLSKARLPRLRLKSPRTKYVRARAPLLESTKFCSRVHTVPPPAVQAANKSNKFTGGSKNPHHNSAPLAGNATTAKEKRGTASARTGDNMDSACSSIEPDLVPGFAGVVVETQLEETESRELRHLAMASERDTVVASLRSVKLTVKLTAPLRQISTCRQPLGYLPQDYDSAKATRLSGKDSRRRDTNNKRSIDIEIKEGMASTELDARSLLFVSHAQSSAECETETEKERVTPNFVMSSGYAKDFSKSTNLAIGDEPSSLDCASLTSTMSDSSESGCHHYVAALFDSDNNARVSTLFLHQFL